jgi:hypothetical protein
MRETLANIGISIATNTALFTGLDLGQRIADAFSLWMLPANLVAAVIATVFGVTLTVASRAFNFGTAAPLAGTAQPVVLPVRADGPASAPDFDVA